MSRKFLKGDGEPRWLGYLDGRRGWWGGRCSAVGGELRFSITQAFLNLPHSLAEAGFVFYQGHAEKTFAGGAEAAAGADGDVAFFEEHHAEIHGAHAGAPGLGDGHPAEHAGFGGRHGPADAGQAFDEGVAAAFVDGSLLLHAGVAVAEGHDGGDLHGLEHAVVVVAFDRGESFDHLAVAGAEADAPAGHVVAFAHRGEFDADIGGTGRGQEARGLVAVEGDIGVGEVADDGEAIFAGEFYDFVEERLLDANGRRVVRVVYDDELRTRVEVLAGVGDVGEEFFAVADFEGDDVARGEGDGIDVDREVGGGDDGGIAGAHHRQAHVAEAFFGAEAGDNFFVGVEADAEAFEVFRGDFAAEVGDAV